MAKTRPFSRYTDGPLFNNAEQIGNLYFGNENTLLEIGDLKWWNGPDEDPGYIIAYEDAQGNHIGADGEQAYLGFKRSSAKTEASFLLLVTKVTGQTFTTGDEAKAYLNANGMWTSYGLETLMPTATPQPTATEVVPTATPEPTLEPTATEVVPTATPEPTLEPTATEVTPTATAAPVPTSTPLAIQLIQRITSSQYTDVTTQGKSTTQLNDYLCQEIPYSWSSNLVYTNGNATPQTGDLITYTNGVPFFNQQRLIVVGDSSIVTNWYHIVTDGNGIATVTQMSPCVTATPVPTLEPTATEVAPTATPEPTATEVAPTATPEPTATEVAPTATPEPTATGTPTSGFTVTIDEINGNVVMSASGTLNINDLTLANTAQALGQGGLGVSSATFIMGANNASFDSYTGFITNATSFGTGGYGGPNSSASGDAFGVIFQGAPPYMLVVPAGYETGDQITSSQTFANTTLAALGLEDGTYTYTWGSGANAETFDVIIGSGAGNGGGGGTPTTIDETLYWSRGDAFNVQLTYNASAVGGNGIGMVNGFYFNKISSDINGSTVGDQTAFLMSLPAGTLISYTNTVNPVVYNGIYEVVSVSELPNTIMVNVNFISTTFQMGSIQDGIAEFHFYSPTTSTAGTWSFYTQPPLVYGPPANNGEIIFTDSLNTGGTESTLNPNKANGVNYLNFSLIDNEGVDHTAEFTALVNNGGTISLSQNGNTATYTIAQGMSIIETGTNPDFAVVNVASASQTVIATSPFTYGDPITVSFN